MAWKFLDESKSSNKKYREEMMQLINSWWAHFQNKRKNIEAYLDGRANMDLEEFMTDSLQSIDEHLMWEYGTEPDGRYQLVITPETERHLRPLVESIVAAAPKMDKWSFYAYRQPHGVEDTADLVRDNSGVALDAVAFAADIDADNLINITFGYNGDRSREAVEDAIFMATEYLLGEEMLDRWIGDMVVTEVKSAKPMTEFPNAIHSLIEKIKKKLPAKPLHQLRSTLKTQNIQVEPEEDEDHTERFDMVSARTLIPEMWQAAHNGAAFDSCRFSRHGERFCYLKLEGMTQPDKLQALEEKVNDALTKDGLGCTTGSAHGNRFGYIDLCLADPMKAIAVLKQICESDCPQHSWLQFFDADWESEWLPLNSKSTTPPGMVEAK